MPSDMQDELLRFLEQNPDLKAEYEEFSMVTLSMDKAPAFPRKASLKKAEGPSGTGHDELFAAYVEGDLDALRAREVEELAASDQQAARELDLMKKTRAIPDMEVTYPARATLKRHFVVPARAKVLYYVSAAAAVLLLAVMFHTMLPNQTGTHFVHELPVDGETELPWAVVAVPSPQQESTPTALPEPEQASPAVADLIQPPPPASIDSERSLVSTAGFSIRPLIAARMSRRQPAALATEQHPATDAGIERREELIWLAYRDPSDIFLTADDPGPEPGRREVSLGQLAMNKLEEGIGVNFETVEGIVSDDRSSLRQLAGRGLYSLNELAGRPVNIEGEVKDDGRRVYLAIGDFFEISRKTE